MISKGSVKAFHFVIIRVAFEVYVCMMLSVFTKYFFEDLAYVESPSVVKYFGDLPMAFFVISTGRSALCWNFVSACYI